MADSVDLVELRDWTFVKENGGQFFYHTHNRQWAEWVPGVDEPFVFSTHHRARDGTAVADIQSWTGDPDARLVLTRRHGDMIIAVKVCLQRYYWKTLTSMRDDAVGVDDGWTFAGDGVFQSGIKPRLASAPPAFDDDDDARQVAESHNSETAQLIKVRSVHASQDSDDDDEPQKVQQAVPPPSQQMYHGRAIDTDDSNNQRMLVQPQSAWNRDDYGFSSTDARAQLQRGRYERQMSRARAAQKRRWKSYGPPLNADYCDYFKAYCGWSALCCSGVLLIVCAFLMVLATAGVTVGLGFATRDMANNIAVVIIVPLLLIIVASCMLCVPEECTRSVHAYSLLLISACMLTGYVCGCIAVFPFLNDRWVITTAPTTRGIDAGVVTNKVYIEPSLLYFDEDARVSLRHGYSDNSYNWDGNGDGTTYACFAPVVSSALASTPSTQPLDYSTVSHWVVGIGCCGANASNIDQCFKTYEANVGRFPVSGLVIDDNKSDARMNKMVEAAIRAARPSEPVPTHVMTFMEHLVDPDGAADRARTSALICVGVGLVMWYFVWQIFICIYEVCCKDAGSSGGDCYCDCYCCYGGGGGGGDGGGGGGGDGGGCCSNGNDGCCNCCGNGDCCGSCDALSDCINNMECCKVDCDSLQFQCGNNGICGDCACDLDDCDCSGFDCCDGLCDAIGNVVGDGIGSCCDTCADCDCDCGGCDCDCDCGDCAC